MKIEKIKPIPKYIISLIKRADGLRCKTPSGFTRYYAYLAKNDGELVKITVAVRNYNGNWYCKQCAIHGIHSEDCLIKDMVFYYNGGYITGWHAEGIKKERKHYETGEWHEHYDHMFDPYAIIVNMNYLQKFPEYKYSQVENCETINVLQYLRLYEKYPQMELLVKLGLGSLAMKKTILNKTSKDKHFAKWLIKHRDEAKHYTHGFLIAAIMEAYKKNMSIMDAQAYVCFKQNLIRERRLKPVAKLFKGDKAIKRLFSYIEKNNTSLYTYADYINACLYLKLDMTEEKNLLPHDFMHWHDERIKQYQILLEKDRRDKETAYRKWCREHKEEIAAQRRQQKERERAERERMRKRRQDIDLLETRFEKIVKRFMKLQNCKCDGFVIFIAKSPAELILEGQKLHHCVGGENYRLGMSKGESLIFFVREATAPDTPFITLEYSPKKQAVLQYHGDHNCLPNSDTLHFINDIWLPYANKTVSKIMRKKAA